MSGPDCSGGGEWILSQITVWNPDTGNHTPFLFGVAHGIELLNGYFATYSTEKKFQEESVAELNIPPEMIIASFFLFS